MTSPDTGTSGSEHTRVEGGGSYRREIAGIALGAVAVLGFVSLTGEAAGAFGTHLSAILRGVAGRAAWLAPVFLLITGVLAFRGRWQPAWGRRIAGLALAFAVILVALHLIDLWPHVPPAQDWRGQIRLGLQGRGGGILGGVAAGALTVAFGPAGTAVLLAAALLTAAVLLFDVSFSRLVAATATGVWRLGTGAVRWTWRGVRYGAEEAAVGARRAWERRRLRNWRRSHEEDRDGESFARPFVPRHRRGGELDSGAADEHGAGDRPWAQEDRPTDLGGPGEWEGEGSDEAAGPVPSPGDGAGTPAGRAPVPAGERAWGSGPVPEGGRAQGPSGESARDGEGAGSRAPLLKLRDWRGAGQYRMPPVSLLELPRPSRRARAAGPEPDRSQKLEETLASFGVEARVVNVSRGPAITRYELQPAPGVKVSKITSLVDDLALSLATGGLRIEAPVPGKAVVGIEVPNQQVSPVYLREVLESEAFVQSTSPLTMALGKDIGGQPVVADLKKILHLLIAGATGSGKSVCLNAIIVSMLYKARPTEVKFIMIDPKRVELAVYDGIPHLISPVVTDPRQAAGALRWAVKEMERRYQLISEAGARNIDGYNAAVARRGDQEAEVLPYLVVIIDELADLMLVAAADVEDSICRLAQMARAAGIFLIIATQRPSVDVITGLIKANVPSRISFAVSSQVDSRTILDMAGAERLLGKGDMLFHPLGSAKPQRVQGAFIGDREVEEAVSFWKAQESPEYVAEVLEVQDTPMAADDEVEDELFEEAVRLVREQGQASVSMIQRRFRVGYSRAARLIDMMELRGIVGPYQGSKPREVLGAYRGGTED